MKQFPTTEDEIEYVEMDGIPEGAIACKLDFPDEDEDWMYDSA